MVYSSTWMAASRDQQYEINVQPGTGDETRTTKITKNTRKTNLQAAGMHAHTTSSYDFVHPFLPSLRLYRPVSRGFSRGVTEAILPLTGSSNTR